MKGLLIKDLINLKKQGIVIGAILIFYMFFSVINQDSAFLITISVLLCTMLPITSLAFDEQAKWDRYALSLPISRKKLVLSKYVLGILLNLGTLAVLSIITLVLHLQSDDPIWLIILAAGGVGLLILSLLLPIMFRFGVEKGRLVMIAVFIIPTILIFMSPYLNYTLPTEQSVIRLLYASPFVIAAILWLSISLSVRIYTKKEF